MKTLGKLRPGSILNFSLFFWAAIIAGTASGYFSWQEEKAKIIALEPDTGDYAALLGITALIFAIYVTLFYGITRRANNIARWAYVVLAGLGVLATFASLTQPRALEATSMYFELIAAALTIASILCLFRRDAVAWFRHKSSPNVRIFH